MITKYGIIQELKDTLAEELDFEHEGHNLEQCAQDLRHLPYVYVPKVDWELTSKVQANAWTATSPAGMDSHAPGRHERPCPPPCPWKAWMTMHPIEL